MQPKAMVDRHIYNPFEPSPELSDNYHLASLFPSKTAFRLSENDQATREFHVKQKYPIQEYALGYVNTLKQMRGVMYSQDLEDLENSIKKEGLLNAPIFAVLDATSAQSYIDVVNETWGGNASLEDLRPQQDGSYVIAIAGHRRTAALTSMCKQDGYHKDNYYIPAQTLTNPDPYTILCLQLAENIFVLPSPDRYAVIIYETYILGMASGRFASKNDFCKQMSMGKDKVTSALRFMELPESIRSLVHEKKIDYGKAVTVQRIAEPYSMYLQDVDWRIDNHDASRVFGHDWDTLDDTQKIERCTEYKMLTLLSESIDIGTKQFIKNISGLIDGWQLECSESAVTIFTARQESDARDVATAFTKRAGKIAIEATGLVATAHDKLEVIPRYLARMPQEELKKLQIRLGKLINEAVELDNLIEELTA